MSDKKQIPGLPVATEAKDNDRLIKRDTDSGSDEGLAVSVLLERSSEQVDAHAAEEGGIHGIPEGERALHTDDFATEAEAQAGTDNSKVLTPLSMRQGLNAGGDAPIYACRAWVNFNGTGTVAIRASGNVSSITDNGTGDYTVNFTTAMPDASYATPTSVSRGTGDESDGNRTANPYSSLTSSVSVQVTVASTQTVTDIEIVNVAIFR